MIEALGIIGMSLLISLVVLAGIYCGGIMGAAFYNLLSE